jgi:hypothetical protein
MTSPKLEKRLVIFPYWTLEDDSSTRERSYNLGENLRTLGWRVTIVKFQYLWSPRDVLIQLKFTKFC